MKRTIATLALAALASTFTALAADPTPTPAPAGNPPPPPQEKMECGRGHHGPRGPMFECLTPAEREQLKAAHKKAIKDPAVVEARKNLQAARKTFMEANKAAMLKADPTVAPVLDKIHKAMKEHRPHHGMGGPEGAPAPEAQ